ncbi:MAG: Methyltransferase [Cyanobacteria bacterium RYN_339]|nr:Methyltransferase [Cyanobacteria bacterium RYN_339]
MSPDEDHGYLGTNLTPAEYYRRHSSRYHNPHAEGIAEALSRLAHHLHGTVLDWGCGDGLVTKLLAHPCRLPAAEQRPGCNRDNAIAGLAFVGADNAPAMVKRYRQETGFPAEVAGFGDALPAADTAVASYALHLATPQEATMMWWRLAEAGVQALVVITPFKHRPAAPAHYFEEIERVSGTWGPDGKTIYGVAIARSAREP